MTSSEMAAKREAAAVRKAKRAEKRAILAVQTPGLYPSKSLQDAPGRARTGVRGSRVRPPVQKRAKRPKSKSMSNLKKELWVEVSAFVRERDRAKYAGRCLACQTNPIQVACHIIPSHEGAATRYDETNLYAGCIPCNGAEKWNRASWVFKHKQMFGAEKIDQLYAKSRQIVQFKRADIIEMTEQFRAKRGALAS